MEEKEKPMSGLRIPTEKGARIMFTVLMLLLLSFIALMVYTTYSDRKIDELKKDLEEKIAKEEKEVSLDSDVLKSLTGLSEITLADDSLSNYRLINFDVANAEYNLLLRLAYAKTENKDFIQYGEDGADSDDPDLFYLDESVLKDYFKKLFGPDIEFKTSDFKTTGGKGVWPRTIIYNPTLKRFEESFSIGNGIICTKCGTTTYYKEIYKASQKEDFIYVYKYIYSMHERDNTYVDKSEPYCKLTTDGAEITISEFSPCTKEPVEELKKEGRIRTYKETYKKQSDGNYYIIKGEWQ